MIRRSWCVRGNAWPEQGARTSGIDKATVAAIEAQIGVTARWYGWLCTIAAVLGVLAAIDSVSTFTGGIFANAALAVGVVLWAAMTSIVMVRTSS